MLSLPSAETGGVAVPIGAFEFKEGAGGFGAAGQAQVETTRAPESLDLPQAKGSANSRKSELTKPVRSSPSRLTSHHLLTKVLPLRRK